jgi:hypothetical protein
MPNRLPHLECLQKYHSKDKKPVQRMLNLSVRTARLRHDLAGDTLQYSDKLFRARLGISNLATGEARDFVKILNNTQNSLTSNPFLGLFSITRDCRRFFVCKKEWPAVYFFKPSKPR